MREDDRRDMIRSSKKPVVPSLLRWSIFLALAGGFLLFLSSLGTGGLGYTGGRIVTSLLVIAIGGTLLLGDATLPVGRARRIVGLAGILATSAAIVVSLFLIWSDLQTNRYAWKVWWLLSALSVHLAHVLALLRPPAATRVLLVTRNVTLGAAILFVAILVGMAFRADVFAPPGALLSACLVVLGAVQVAGSVVVWTRALPPIPTARLPRGVIRLTWGVAVPVVVFAAGFYLGRISAPSGGVAGDAAGFLAGLSPSTIDERLRDDLTRLRVAAEGIEALQPEARDLHERLRTRRESAGGGGFTPSEEDAIRALFVKYLSYRAMLLRMVAFYQGFEGVRDLEQRARCFLVGFTAGAMCLNASLALVSTYGDDALLREKLNEEEPIWGIPAGTFDRIRWGIASKENLVLFEEMTAYLEVHREEWRECGLEAEDLRFLMFSIEHAIPAVRNNPLYGKRAPGLAATVERVKKDAYRPVYAVQSLVSTWIGDTRLVSRPACISPQQVEEMREKLQPGDIILERRNWFLSNAFLPGFWPHAALYVGAEADLARLGLLDEAAVKSRLAAYRRPAHDGEPKVVIESISEGVSFSSLSEATLADYIAVLRPRRLSADQKAEAIRRAFSHQGKPYDFEFDFETSDKLVCTELVYRSYEGMLDLTPIEIMGRRTLPALEIARKFAEEARSPDRELDLILFLDTPAGTETALWAGEAEFIASIDRPRAFNE